MTWKDNKDAFALWMIVLIIALYCVFSLTGCAAVRQDKAQTDTVKHETTTIDCSIPFPVVFPDGMHTVEIPIHLTMQRDASEVAKTDATRTSTLQIPEIGNAVRAAIAQFAPGLGALMGPPPQVDHTGAIIGGIGALSALLAAVAKARADANRFNDVVAEKDKQIEFHKADSTEAYKQLAAVGKA